MFAIGFSIGSASTIGTVKGAMARVFNFTSGTLPNGISYSRNSPATQFDIAGHMSNVANDVPRFSFDPIIAQSVGLLVENERTNILPHAIATRNDWSRSGATVTDLTLDALGYFPGVSVISGGQNWHRILDHATLIANQVYAVTMLYRAGSSGMAAVTLKDGTSGAASSISGSIGMLAAENASAGPVSQLTETLLSDGLTYRCTLLYTPNFSGSFNIGFGPDSKTAGEDVILLGMQMEPASDASSFILSTNAATIRAADQVGIVGVTGLHDVLITYGDNSQELLQAQSIADGYWPNMTQNTVKQIALTAL